MGVLDLGSTSFHLLVADVDAPAGVVSRVSSEKQMVGLGEIAELDEATWRRALDSVSVLLRPVAGRLPIVGVATSALREARNGEAFVLAIRDRWGVDVRVVSGAEEARLAFLGITAGQPVVPSLAIDLGGGSVELAAGLPGGPVGERVSLPLGVLRLHRRGLAGAALVAEVCRVAGPAASRLASAGALRVYAGAGTARQIGQLVGASVSADVLDRLAARLEATPAAFREGVDEERRETIATGTRILATLASLLGVPELHLVPRGIREGALLDASPRPMRLGLAALAAAQ
jgi:exopolyphosphatase/guanosine-5'-triphosphate,3'-diphosphate pyrophosphatase